eukprot:GHVU01073591.1.p1 GENE.GHVU01073591.1~~GHVU01073591.1.p1  ORF type:complete len:236 (-),score=13.25 GHVU01073591.1:118-825(-)
MRGSSRAVLLSTDYGKMTLVEVVDTRRNTLENAKTSDSATVTLHVLNTAANKYSDVFTELVKGKLNPDSEDVLVFLQPENNVIVPLEHPKASETHPKVISVLLADDNVSRLSPGDVRSTDSNSSQDPREPTAGTPPVCTRNLQACVMTRRNVGDEVYPIRKAMSIVEEAGEGTAGPPPVPSARLLLMRSHMTICTLRACWLAQEQRRVGHMAVLVSAFDAWRVLMHIARCDIGDK